MLCEALHWSVCYESDVVIVDWKDHRKAAHELLLAIPPPPAQLQLQMNVKLF